MQGHCRAAVRGPGTQTLAFDPNHRDEKTGKATRIGFPKTPIVLTAVHDENATRKGRRLYEISGTPRQKLYLVAPLRKTQAYWLIVVERERAVEVVGLRRGDGR